MKTYADYLSEFKDKILSVYEKEKYDNQLAEWVHEVPSKPQYLTKINRPLRAYRVGAEEPPPITEISTQPADPVQVGISLNVSEWARDPERFVMDILLGDIARTIANREASVILDRLLKTAGHTIQVSTKGELHREEIQQAEAILRQNEYGADTLVVDPEQESRFLQRGELVESWRLRPFYRERGSHFAGLIGGLEMFWTPLIKGFALVYERGYVSVSKSSMLIEFDNVEQPTRLTVNRWYAASPQNEKAVVKIVL